MEKYHQENDVILFGRQVTTFPAGIKDAFGDLMKVLGNERAYYGISWCAADGSIIYYAMAPETFAGEARQHNYEILTLPKGEYLTETIVDWMSKTDCIKDVFYQLLGDKHPDKNCPCIEWYKSDEEMLYRVKNR